VKSKLHNNIRQALLSRLCRLQSEFDACNEISHEATKGAARERLLRSLLSELLSPNFLVTDVIIVDITGHKTPQLDLIVADIRMAPLPKIAESQPFIPIESALLTIEIKSTLKGSDREQLFRQHQALTELRPIVHQEATYNVPMFVFTGKCEVALEVIKKWCKEMSWFNGVCALGSKYLYSVQGDLKQVNIEEEFDETLIFISHMLGIIDREIQKRPTPHIGVWRSYIEGWDSDVI